MEKFFFSFLLGLVGMIWGGMVVSACAEEITPYKYTDPNTLPSYTVPHSSMFKVARSEKADDPPILYYATFPKERTYPIAILAQGSIAEGQPPLSIIRLHRFFLHDFLNLGVGVITVEDWGVTDNHIDIKQFFDHYTRSQRVRDHQAVIDHIKANPPQNWNGKFIFVGGSEGAYVIRQLTEGNPKDVLASMALVGIADGVWRDHLWAFVSQFQKTMPWYMRLATKLPSVLRPKSLPPTRPQYDQMMNSIIYDPSPEKYFLGYTHKFHADALLTPSPDYSKIHTPFLVVSGALDDNIIFSDLFVQKAQKARVPITYLRIKDMGHNILERSDVLAQAFDWLRSVLATPAD